MVAPAGPEALVLTEMTAVLAIGAAVILAGVVALTAWAVLGKRSARPGTHPTERALIVGGGVVFTSVTLAALLVYSLVRSQAVQAPAQAAVHIEVTGEQWWWRVRYLDGAGQPDFETANEIHVPVGRPVLLELKSADVIHSFWVPALAGKLDMIPGRVNRLRLLADRPGEHRGQCAEYCGGPHGLMAFLVVALEPAQFERWVTRQREPAATTHALFESRCSACHTVRGTAARGTLGPDLTHVGSRRTIGAGLVPLNAGTLAGWIAASQHLKPGNLMPSFGGFGSEELRELAAYLQALR